MEEIEGAIHITRLSRDSDPRPWTYDIAFAPYSGGSGMLPVRKVEGDEALRQFLRDGVGVLPEFLDGAIERARAGSASIPRVRLTPEQKRALRL